MQQYLTLLNRKALVVNLDPANDSLPMDDDDASNIIYNVCEEAVNLQAVCEQMSLGPNGGLMYCMEYIEAHIAEIATTIEERISSIQPDSSYLLLDFPGQVELYTHSSCVYNLLKELSRLLNIRFCVVQLVDSQFCRDASKFVSAALLSTTSLLRLELPTVSVLSKMDLLLLPSLSNSEEEDNDDDEGASSDHDHDQLCLPLDFFTQCHDLDRLLPFLDTSNLPTQYGNEWEADVLADDDDYQRARQRRRQSKSYIKFHKLHQSLAEVVGDFGLLSFVPLNISSAESVGRVLAKIDQANGYVFLNHTQQQQSSQTPATATANTMNETLFQCAMRQGESEWENMADIRERIGSPEMIKELQTKR